MTNRVLIAGFGNVLRGDDGFGMSVVQTLEKVGDLNENVVVLEVGTGGIGLVQALMDGFDCLIVVDAASRGGVPGTVSVLEVKDVDEARVVDLHLATPAQALPLARSLGILPERVYLVVCEAENVEELTMSLSPRVAKAVPRAVIEVRSILASSHTKNETTETST